MVDIIKNYNYKAPANGKTIIHGKYINRLFTLLNMDAMDGKFFQIIPNIWVYLEDHPLKGCFNHEGTLLDVDYCNTNEKKSLYLKQLNIVFERLNTIPAGKKLLNYLSTYRPLNSLHEKQVTLIHRENFILDKNTNTLHPANIIIMPPVNNLVNLWLLFIYENSELEKLDLNKIPLYGQNGLLMYIPDALLSCVEGNRYIFQDPVISLAHELIHGLHSILGIYNSMYQHRKDKADLKEEYLTYGGPDMNYVKEDIKNTFYSLNDRLKSTADVLNSSKDTLYNKNIFARQFALKGSGSNYTHTPGDEVGVYTKAYIELTEQQFLKEFGIVGRKTYNDKSNIVKEIDVTDKKYYTIKKGLNYEKIPELKLHNGYIRRLKVYHDMDDSQIAEYYTQKTGWKL